MHRPKWMKSGFEASLPIMEDPEENVPLLSDNEFINGLFSNVENASELETSAEILDSSILEPLSPPKTEFEHTSPSEFCFPGEIKELFLLHSILRFAFSKNTNQNLSGGFLMATKDYFTTQTPPSIHRHEKLGQELDFFENYLLTYFEKKFGSFGKTLHSIWEFLVSTYLRLRSFLKNLFPRSPKDDNSQSEDYAHYGLYKTENIPQISTDAKGDLLPFSGESSLSVENVRERPSSSFTTPKLVADEEEKHSDSEITRKNSFDFQKKLDFEENIYFPHELLESLLKIDPETRIITNSEPRLSTRTFGILSPPTSLPVTEILSEEILEKTSIGSERKLSGGVALSEFAAIAILTGPSAEFATTHITKPEVTLSSPAFKVTRCEQPGAGTNVAQAETTQVSNVATPPTYPDIDAAHDDFFKDNESKQKVKLTNIAVSTEIHGIEKATGPMNDFPKKICSLANVTCSGDGCERSKFAPTDLATLDPEKKIQAEIFSSHKNEDFSVLPLLFNETTTTTVGIKKLGITAPLSLKECLKSDISLTEPEKSSADPGASSEDHGDSTSTPTNSPPLERDYLEPVCEDTPRAVLGSPDTRFCLENLDDEPTDLALFRLETKANSSVENIPSSFSSERTFSTSTKLTSDSCSDIFIAPVSDPERNLIVSEESPLDIDLNGTEIIDGSIIEGTLNEKKGSDPKKDTNETTDETTEQEDLAEMCRLKIFTNHLSWMKTELMLLDFENDDNDFSSQARPRIVLFVEDESQHESDAGTDLESETDDDTEDAPWWESKLAVPEPKESESFLILEAFLAQIDEGNSNEVVQDLRQSITTYRSRFLRQINEIVRPCNSKVKEFVNEFLVIRRSMWELFSSVSAFDIELKIACEALESDNVNSAHWQTKLTHFGTSVSEIESKATDIQSKVHLLEIEFDLNFKNIIEMISEINGERDSMLEDYDQFCELNAASINLESYSIHDCTHVEDYEKGTSWHYFLDIDEFKELFTDDIQALTSSKMPLETFVKLVRAGLENFEKKLGAHLVL